jgi:hypothetical protein
MKREHIAGALCWTVSPATALLLWTPLPFGIWAGAWVAFLLTNPKRSSC